MFAVVKTGGKQYKVAKNDVIKVEKLEGEPGATILLEEVLAYNDGKKTTLGTPVVKDIKVAAEVLEQKKDDKVLVFKKKRRHNYRRTVGHRQEVAILRIQDIGADVKAKTAPKASASSAPKAETKPVEAKQEVAKAAPAKKVETKAALAEKKAADKKPAAKKATTSEKAPAAKAAPAKTAVAKKTTTKQTTDK